jgi:hypothetical protein
MFGVKKGPTRPFTHSYDCRWPGRSQGSSRGRKAIEFVTLRLRCRLASRTRTRIRWNRDIDAALEGR